MRRSVNVLSLSPFDDVNMRCLFALLVCLPSLLAITPRTVTIRVKQNITQECPNVRSDQSIVVRDSIGFDMNEINTGMGGMDSLHMITQTGEHKRITFPGCYNARLSMRVTRPLVNPYAEVFMQMGSDIPCRKQNQQRFQEPLTVCTNITRTNWCPKSANQQVRGMLDNKQTCQFCNLCESAIEEAQKNNDKARKFISVTSGDVSQQCTIDNPDAPYTLNFRMCTPDRNEMQKQQKESGADAEQYWQYLKQGVMTVVVHLMERTVLSPPARAHCERLCNTYQATTGGYRNTLLQSISQICTPRDEYVACIFHTIKFDVSAQGFNQG